MRKSIGEWELKAGGDCAAGGEVKWCQSDVASVRVLCSRGAVKCGGGTKGKHICDLEWDKKGG